MNSLSTQRHGGTGDFWSIAGRVALAGTLIGVASCAMLDRRSPQEIVKERAQGRWDALVSGDLPKAFGYFSPGSRAVLQVDRWSTTIKKGFWKSAVVERVECPSADSCDAIASIEYELQGRRTKTPLRETWIREGSNWWYVQK